MNLIKFYGILTFLVALAFVILSFSNLNQNKMIIPEKGKILPQEDWMDAIAGDWNIHFRIQNPREIIDVTGKVQHLDDGGFRDDLNYRHYRYYKPYEVKINKDMLVSIGKFTRQGKISYNEDDAHIWKSTYRDTGYCNHAEIWADNARAFRGDEEACNVINELMALIGNKDYGNQIQILTLTQQEIFVMLEIDEIEKPVVVRYERSTSL